MGTEGDVADESECIIPVAGITFKQGELAVGGEAGGNGIAIARSGAALIDTDQRCRSLEPVTQINI